MGVQPFDYHLRTVNDVADLLDRSRQEPIVLFKHSTTCPISARAYAEVDRYLRQSPESRPKAALVRVREERPASLEVEARLAVKHESPQLIVVSGGESRGELSHGAITAEAVAALVGAVKSH